MERDEIEQALRMEDALNEMGLSMYTDDWAAKILAFMYCLNGTSEVIMTNPALNFAIQCCMKKLYPENRINATLAMMLLDHIKELREKGLQTLWINDIAVRYGLTDINQLWNTAGYSGDAQRNNTNEPG
jgi:hypothetical protein